MQPTAFFAASDIVVVDSNPEMADYTNPRGLIYGVSSYVVAEDARGNRCRLYVATGRYDEDVLPAADRLAQALNARLACGKLPVAFDRWEDARPAYGSDAYIEYGQYDDIELERREAEDEMFA
jgi:hypothetical protein